LDGFKRFLEEKTGFIQVSSAAVIWGSYGLFVRGLNYPSEVIVFFRFLFGFCFMAMAAGIAGRMAWAESKRAWKGLLITGILSSLSWHAYTFALKYTSIANAAFLLYTAPVFVVLLTPLFLKEEVEKRSFFALAVSLAGTVVIMKGNGFSLGSSGWLGDFIALMGGFIYALTVMGLKRLPAQTLGLTANVYLSLITSLSTLPFVIRHFHLVKAADLFPLIALGIMQQGAAASLYYAGLAKIKAHQAGILTYFDPLFAVIFAFLFLHEGLSWFSVVGGVLVLTGGIIVLRGNGKNAEVPKQMDHSL